MCLIIYISWSLLEVFNFKSFIASLLSNISSIVNFPSFILLIRGISAFGSYNLFNNKKINQIIYLVIPP